MSGQKSPGDGSVLSTGSGGEFPNSSAFVALKEDGSVVAWGADWGGDSSAVSGDLSCGVTEVFSAADAFAALKDDGSVVTWGRSRFGGDSSAVSGDLSGGVTEVFSTGSAFAALKNPVVAAGRRRVTPPDPPKSASSDGSRGHQERRVIGSQALSADLY